MTDSIFLQETIFPMIVSALAAYRMARMMVSETGPFAIFARIRRHIDPQQKTWIGIGLNCPYCMGLWSSLFFYWLLTYNQNTTAHFLVNVLAIAGVQTIIQSWEPIPPPPPDEVQNSNGNSHQVSNGNTKSIDSKDHQEVQPLSK
jgi:H+/Cl- antiporter ClcA